MSAALSDPDLLSLVARIVCAHATRNPVTVETLRDVIRSVYDALSGAGSMSADGPPASSRHPAVPIKKSVFPDHIICLEDGKKLKTLKGHLKAAHGLTPKQYRERWGLPDGYPMTAPDYSALRTSLAHEIGLGKKVPLLPAPLSEEPSPPPIRQVAEGVSGRRAAPKPVTV